MKTNLLKKVIKTVSLNIVLFSFLACSQSQKHMENIGVDKVEITDDFESINKDEATYNEKQGAELNTLPENLKIIKSANAKYKVKNVKLATKQIKRVALKYGAYISDLRFENNLHKKENRFTIKVPKNHFDAIMDSISNLTEFTDFENITTQDVTEEYVDLQTRLTTKLEVKKRYEDILRKKAKTIKDILATEDKLRVIQEEIEAAQGRLKYLTSKVSYSTIQIDLYETVDFQEKPMVYNKTFWFKIKDGLAFGWHFLSSLLLGIIHVWPLIIIGIIAYVFFKKRLKHKNK